MSRLIRRFVVGVAAGVGAVLALRYWQKVDEERHKRRREEPGEPGPAEPTDPAAAAPGEPEPAEPTDDVAPEPGEPAEVKGVIIPDPEALLAFANGAEEAALQSAGLTANAIKAVLAHRPFASVEALGSTKGIGKKTLEALRDSA
jgi:hypothetical protein